MICVFKLGEGMGIVADTLFLFKSKPSKLELMNTAKDLILGDEPIEIVHTVNIPNRTLIAAGVLILVIAIARLAKK